MTPVGVARHKVAIVRVEIPDAQSPEFLIEILEVGSRPGSDRLLGRATNPVGVCLILQEWLAALADELERDRRRPGTNDGAADS
jgi:hypothetical protein